MIKKMLQCALIGGALLGSAAASQAASVPFANFGQSDQSLGFSYVGVAPPGTSNFTAKGVKVDFKFLSLLGGDINASNVNTNTIYSAILTFAGTASQGDNSFGLGTNPFDTTSFTFTGTGALAGKILLAGTSGTGNGDGGVLSAPAGGSSSSFSSSNPGDNVKFTSQVINTTGISAENYSLGFNSVSSNNHYGNPSTQPYLTSFNANGSGNFGAAVTPEPGVMAVMGAMFVGGAFGLRRRRK